jgi:hypothetical protein
MAPSATDVSHGDAQQSLRNQSYLLRPGFVILPLAPDGREEVTDQALFDNAALAAPHSELLSRRQLADHWCCLGEWLSSFVQHSRRNDAGKH